MSSFKINSFTSYILSEVEERSGKILNLQQQQVIQNLIADAAQSRLNMNFDILNPGQFCMDEAFLKGQITAYQYLLDLSKEEEAQLSREASEQANNEE